MILTPEADDGSCDGRVARTRERLASWSGYRGGPGAPALWSDSATSMIMSSWPPT